MGCTSLFLCYIWSGWVALCMSLGKAGITVFESLRHAHVSFISQNHIEEWNMLFSTGQVQLTCSSVLQATSGPIHGALTTPQAKVWCGTQLDMGGAAWNGSNLVKHQTTRAAKLMLETFILTSPNSLTSSLLDPYYACIQGVDQIIYTLDSKHPWDHGNTIWRCKPLPDNSKKKLHLYFPHYRLCWEVYMTKLQSNIQSAEVTDGGWLYCKTADASILDICWILIYKLISAKITIKSHAHFTNKEYLQENWVGEIMWDTES